MRGKLSTAELAFSGVSLTSSELCRPPPHRTCVYMCLSEFKTREMEARTELKQKFYEIFEEFMTGCPFCSGKKKQHYKLNEYFLRWINKTSFPKTNLTDTKEENFRDAIAAGACLICTRYMHTYLQKSFVSGEIQG
ncbi:Zinc finger-XS domain protein [Raphanus sativus]|nr:Zinc finger-XS domain protein [Raphanus sativus]